MPEPTTKVIGSPMLGNREILPLRQQNASKQDEPAPKPIFPVHKSAVDEWLDMYQERVMGMGGTELGHQRWRNQTGVSFSKDARQTIVATTKGRPRASEKARFVDGGMLYVPNPIKINDRFTEPRPVAADPEPEPAAKLA